MKLSETESKACAVRSKELPADHLFPYNQKIEMHHPSTFIADPATIRGLDVV